MCSFYVSSGKPSAGQNTEKGQSLVFELALDVLGPNKWQRRDGTRNEKLYLPITPDP